MKSMLVDDLWEPLFYLVVSVGCTFAAGYLTVKGQPVSGWGQ